jgi:hypothetical protein
VDDYGRVIEALAEELEGLATKKQNTCELNDFMAGLRACLEQKYPKISNANPVHILKAVMLAFTGAKVNF